MLEITVAAGTLIGIVEKYMDSKIDFLKVALICTRKPMAPVSLQQIANAVQQQIVVSQKIVQLEQAPTNYTKLEKGEKK